MIQAPLLNDPSKHLQPHIRGDLLQHRNVLHLYHRRSTYLFSYTDCIISVYDL